MPSTLSVNGWGKWQSYRKDRGTPPWIKIYRNLFSSQKWSALSDSEKGQLISIWILAADRKGEIPADPVVIKKMCMLDTEPDLPKFINLGFILSSGCQGGVKVASEESQGDQPETETETETETEKKKNTPFQAVLFLKNLGVEKQVSDDWLKVRKTKRLANTQTAFDSVKREISKTDRTPNEIITICAEKGWGSFKASWPLDDQDKKSNGGTCDNSCFSFKTCQDLGKLKTGKECGAFNGP